MVFFQYFISLVSVYVSGLASVIIFLIAAGLLFASPYIVRRVIDYV